MILADIGSFVNRPSIEIELPDELATQLVEDGRAGPAADRRSDTSQVIATYATGAATTVSLLQTPQTITYFADKCRKLATRKHEKLADRYVMDAKGSHGQLRIPVTLDTSTAEIERLLRKTISNQALAE